MVLSPPPPTSLYQVGLYIFPNVCRCIKCSHLSPYRTANEQVEINGHAVHAILSPAVSRGNDSYNTNSLRWLLSEIISTPCILAMAAIPGQCFLFFVQSSQLCGYYLRAATIRGWSPFEEIQYLLN